MPTTEPAAETAARDLARECLYRFLAAAVAGPYADSWPVVLDPTSQHLAREAADLLREEASAAPPGPIALGELPPEPLTLLPLLTALNEPGVDVRAEYDRVFGLVLARECPPYETEYHPSSETFFRSQQLADIAGFYRAFGLEPARQTPERPDHLALELEFMAFVLLKQRLAADSMDANPALAEAARVCAEAQRTFFRDHLAWWLPAFSTGLRRKAGGGFYTAVGHVLAALIAAERRYLGVDTAPVPARPDLIERPEEQTGCAACPVQN
jgi:TorA maturation chaperone TorD